MIRTLAASAVAAAALLALPGTASAAESGYVSGYEGAGLIMVTSTTPADSCATRRAFYVVHTDDPELPQAWRSDSAPGAGWVCVSKTAFGAQHIGNWWSGRASGPRG
jgi:hypothetical protein